MMLMDRELIDLNTPWGKPSDKILKTKFLKKEVFFFLDMGEVIISAHQILILEPTSALKQSRSY